MSTQGATSLNRIFKTTANLLFEKGEDVAAVANLLQGFVAPRMVRQWYERYCEVNGLRGTVNSARKYRRMPMPPIDFKSIEVKDLESLAAEKEEKHNTPEW